MVDAIKLVAQMRAFEAKRAIPIASHQQVVIQPHALVICPLAMAGEDTTIHAIAVGRVGAPPQIRVIPDPRVRDDQYGLVLWLGGIVETYFQQCRMGGDFPQIWTSSAAAADHLDVLADRLRFVRDNAPVQRIGALLTYATERAPIECQQALMTMTGALSAHYATGQQDGENEHLGTLLVWLDPPADCDFYSAVACAEREVMGVKTNPEFDARTLHPLVSGYHKAVKGGASAKQIQMRAATIQEALAPIVEAIYTATQSGFRFLSGRFPPPGGLADLARRETETFANFMQARDNGLPLPYRDTPKAGAFKLAEREHAAQSVQSSAILGDAVSQARARLSGVILSGRVRNLMSTKARRTNIHRFVVETSQTNLRVRQRDELAYLLDPRLRCVIEGVHRQGPLTSLQLRISAGMRSVGVPRDGTTIELAPPPPDWHALGRERIKMASRLTVTPWTHARDAAVPADAAHNSSRPADILRAIEVLR